MTTTADLLRRAAEALSREEVRYGLGLDADCEIEFTTIEERGVERPYTREDQRRDIEEHGEFVVALLDRAAALDSLAERD